MDPDLTAPDILYCGFQRSGKIPHAQSDQEALQVAASQEVVLTISLATNEPYNFELSIHKQADVQTLARTVETLLADRRVIVACLIDKESDNVLRWTDRVHDVLDADSTVVVLPLNEDKLLRELTAASRPTTPRRSSPRTKRLESIGDDARKSSRDAPRAQLEFIHLSDRQSSIVQESPVSPTSGTRPAISEGRRSTSKGLRLLRPNGVRRPSDITPIDSSSPTYLPPLPSTPMPRAIVTPLDQLCSNAIGLSAFLRYCSRKKTLCELLFWLDSTTSTPEDEDYVNRVYLTPEAPLRLNLPREVSTILEARELLKDGPLAWSADRFLVSQDGLRITKIEMEHPAYYARAKISLSGKVHPERTKFLSTLTSALDPEDTSILSLKERQVVDTRQAILEQVYAQYLPNDKHYAAKYFEYTLEQMTKPERHRLANRRNMFGALFDRRSPPLELGQIKIKQDVRTTLQAPSRGVTPKPIEGARIGEIMPMEDADVDGWTDVKDPSPETDTRDTKSVTLVSEPTSPTKTIDSHANGDGISAITTPPQKVRRTMSRASSMMSEDPHGSPVMTLTETQRSDLLKRQTKLRTLLGVTPVEAIHAQAENMMGDYVDESTTAESGRHSPTQSVISRFSATSSHMSSLRRDQSEDHERRTQARRAAKLYAMFGEHTDSSTSIPSYRNNYNGTRNSISEFSARPASSASQYSPAYSRVPGRPGSISGQSLYSPSVSRNFTPNSVSGRSDSRYQPDRQVNRKGSKISFGMFKTAKNPVSSSDILSNFPSPPSTGSPNANTFNRAFPRSGHYTSSLYQDDESIMEVDSDEEDDEGEAIVQDVRTNMKLRQLLGNDAPTSTVN